MLTMMVRIRAFEMKLAELVRDLVIKGTLHPYVGQEAVAIGVCTALGPDDVIVTVATDGAAMYGTEIERIVARDFPGGFGAVEAAETFGQHVLGAGTDDLLELTPAERERIFNLGYFTWVEQQGVSFADFVARHDQAFWRDLRASVPAWDDAIRESLRRIDILGPLGEEDLDSLARHVRLRVYGRGETVVRQGEEGDSLFIVLQGGLEVRFDGKKVGELSEGEFFGEMSLLTGERRRATVVAAEEVRLIEVSKEALAPVISSHPSILTGLSDRLERRLEQIAAARRTGAEAVEPLPPQDAILRKLMRFFGIS